MIPFNDLVMIILSYSMLNNCRSDDLVMFAAPDIHTLKEYELVFSRFERLKLLMIGGRYNGV